MCALWLLSLGKMKLSIKTYECSWFRVVCEDHFEPTEFEEDHQAILLGYKPRKVLKPNFVPTIFTHEIWIHNENPLFLSCMIMLLFMYSEYYTSFNRTKWFYVYLLLPFFYRPKITITSHTLLWILTTTSYPIHRGLIHFAPLKFSKIAATMSAYREPPCQPSEPPCQPTEPPCQPTEPPCQPTELSI